MTSGGRPRFDLDVEQVKAMYEAGDSMRAIGDHFGVTRHRIRKELLAADVPTRPAGRQRLNVSTQAVAKLYESGMTMTETATQLGIHPDAARERYKEARQRRGIIKTGYWHKVLLTAVDRSEVVLVLPAATADLGRRPTKTEAQAVRRAARELARAGAVCAGRITCTWNGHHGPFLSIARPGNDPNDAKQIRGLPADRPYHQEPQQG